MPFAKTVFGISNASFWFYNNNFATKCPFLHFKCQNHLKLEVEWTPTNDIQMPIISLITNIRPFWNWPIDMSKNGCWILPPPCRPALILFRVYLVVTYFDHWFNFYLANKERLVYKNIICWHKSMLNMFN